MPEGEPKPHTKNDSEVSHKPESFEDSSRKPVERSQFLEPNANAEELVEKMFNFEPVQPLTEEEMALMRQYSLEQAEGYLSLLKDGRRGVGGGSRGLYQYGNVEEMIAKAFEEKGTKVKILDVGCGQAHMLHELKEKLGDKVETHGLAPVDDEILPIDQFHLLHAEYLPKEFENKFDVITSQVAIDYSLLPHVALRNIARCLAEDGVARVSYDYGREHREWDETTLASNLKNYLQKNKHDKLSAGGIKLIKEGTVREECKKIFMNQTRREEIQGVSQEQWNKMLEDSTQNAAIRQEAEKKVSAMTDVDFDNFAKGALPINEKLVKAWTNAVAELLEDQELKVRVFYGYKHPARVEFRRKNSASRES